MKLPLPKTRRQQLAERDATDHGRHSIEHLIHDTNEDNINARMAIGRRIRGEIVQQEAFRRAGRNPWVEAEGFPRHAAIALAPAPF